MQERIAWLRRMPTKWRALLAGQSLVFIMALRIRMNDINRSKELVAQREAAARQQQQTSVPAEKAS
jgi:hypothetical protein